MAELLVKTNEMARVTNKEQALAKKLAELSAEISGVRQNLSFHVRSRAQIDSQLQKLERVCNQNSAHVNSLAKALSDAAGLYTATENRVSGNPTGGKAKSKSNGGSGTKKKTKDSIWSKIGDLWDYFEGWKLIGAAGPVGAAVSAIGKWITKGDPVAGGLGVASAIAKITGYYAKNSNSSFDWKLVAMGIEKGFSFGEKKNFFAALGDEFGKLKFSNAKTVTDKVAVGAKWAGYALTAITTIHENFHDPENTTFGRRLAESIGESAIKIGGGIAIGAGVAAGFAAAGVAAPAIVVGGVTVGATWLINKGFEHFTGKGAAECISDWVLDGPIGSTCKNVGEAIGNTAKEAGKKISGWWKSLW